MHLLGLGYFKQMANLEPAFTRDKRLQVDWIARGKYPIGFCASADNVEQYVKAGVPIVEYTPEEGSYLTYIGGSIALLNRAPHPNAAKVFLNFLLSKEGQDIWTRNEEVQSARLDVSTEGLRPENLRRPGMKYIHGDQEDIALGKAKHIEIAREIFRDLMK